MIQAKVMARIAHYLQSSPITGAHDWAIGPTLDAVTFEYDHAVKVQLLAQNRTTGHFEYAVDYYYRQTQQERMAVFAENRVEVVILVEVSCKRVSAFMLNEANGKYQSCTVLQGVAEIVAEA
jgi:hypothetical protein